MLFFALVVDVCCVFDNAGPAVPEEARRRDGVSDIVLCAADLPSLCSTVQGLPSQEKLREKIVSLMEGVLLTHLRSVS